MGKEPDADVNSSISAADSFKTSPLVLFTESFRGFLAFSSVVSSTSMIVDLTSSPLLLFTDAFLGFLTSSGIS